MVNFITFMVVQFITLFFFMGKFYYILWLLAMDLLYMWLKS